MTNKTNEKKETTKSFNDKFAYGILAQRFLRNKETADYATGALDILAKEGLGLSEEAKGFIEGAYSSQEGIETASNIYAGNFANEMGKAKPSELTSWYNPVLSSIEDADKKTILSTLSKQTETVADIEKKYMEAQYKTNAPKGMFKDEEVTKAKDTLKNYNEFFQVKGTLDNFKFESLREKAVNATRDRKLTGLASKL